MGHEHFLPSKSGLTTTGIFAGGLVGGVVGALVRGGITYYHLHVGGEFGLLASLPSAGIGLLCGAIAGCFCRAWFGCLVGAFLSAGVFALFVLPFSYLFGLFNAADKVVDVTWILFVQKAVAGAIAGGIGGFTGGLIVASQKPEVMITKSRTPVSE